MCMSFTEKALWQGVPSPLDFIKIDEVLGSAPLILPHLPKL
ncbi:hypothetical protein PPL19_12693 [Pseudomonas psychrotolerans L19]|nr:hypothetical protein PPL19_12693 [Pseudomonas psychrotolerans L19]